MSGYDLIILATVAGFFLLAYLLLAPVYRFLNREERVSRQWTAESLARRSSEASGNGKHAGGDEAKAE